MLPSPARLAACYLQLGSLRRAAGGMLVEGLVLLGTAFGGLLAVVSLRRSHGAGGSVARKKDKERQPKRGSSGRARGQQLGRGQEGGERQEDWSARDGRLLRELQDDMELRLRRVRRLPPGEERM